MLQRMKEFCEVNYVILMAEIYMCICWLVEYQLILIFLNWLSAMCVKIFQLNIEAMLTVPAVVVRIQMSFHFI